MPVYTRYNASMVTKKSKPTKVTMMWPPELIEAMKALASAHGRSWNGEVVWALNEYVKNQRHHEREAG